MPFSLVGKKQLAARGSFLITWIVHPIAYITVVLILVDAVALALSARVNRFQGFFCALFSGPH
jgi:hypothetical protein